MIDKESELYTADEEGCLPEYIFCWIEYIFFYIKFEDMYFFKPTDTHFFRKVSIRVSVRYQVVVKYPY